MKRLILAAALALLAATATAQALVVGPPPTKRSPCRASQLRISLGFGSAASGREGFPIVFRDRGGPCTIRGFALVSGVTAGGRIVARAKDTLSGFLPVPDHVVTVIVRTGQPAAALLGGDDPAFLPSHCVGYSVLSVAPPDGGHATRLRLPVEGGTPTELCNLTIGPVSAGVTGEPAG